MSTRLSRALAIGIVGLDLGARAACAAPLKQRLAAALVQPEAAQRAEREESRRRREFFLRREFAGKLQEEPALFWLSDSAGQDTVFGTDFATGRSEERRVGRYCRSGWSR